MSHRRAVAAAAALLLLLQLVQPSAGAAAVSLPSASTSTPGAPGAQASALATLPASSQASPAVTSPLPTASRLTPSPPAVTSQLPSATPSSPTLLPPLLPLPTTPTPPATTRQPPPSLASPALPATTEAAPEPPALPTLTPTARGVPSLQAGTRAVTTSPVVVASPSPRASPSPVTSPSPVATTSPTVTPSPPANTTVRRPPPPGLSPPTPAEPPPPKAYPPGLRKASPPPPPRTTPPSPIESLTSLSVTMTLTGDNLWPFTTQKAARLIRSIGDVLTNVKRSQIIVQNALQTDWTRRRLLALGSGDVYLELNADTHDAALALGTDLQGTIDNGALRTALINNNLPVSANGISLSDITTVLPSTSSTLCQYGSVAGSCISKAEGEDDLSTGAIVGIAIGCGVAALGIGFLFLWYCFLRNRCCQGERGATDAPAEAPKKAMTPMAALPFWLKGKNAEQGNGEVNVGAIAAGTEVHPTAPGPQFSIQRNQFGDEVPREGIPAGAHPLDGQDESDLRGQHHAEYVEMGGREGRERLGMRLPEFASTGKQPSLSKQKSGLSGTDSGVPESAISSPYNTTPSRP